MVLEPPTLLIPWGTVAASGLITNCARSVELSVLFTTEV